MACSPIAQVRTDAADGIITGPPVERLMPAASTAPTSSSVSGSPYMTDVSQAVIGDAVRWRRDGDQIRDEDPPDATSELGRCVTANGIGAGQQPRGGTRCVGRD